MDERGKDQSGHHRREYLSEDSGEKSRTSLFERVLLRDLLSILVSVYRVQVLASGKPWWVEQCAGLEVTGLVCSQLALIRGSRLPISMC